MIDLHADIEGLDEATRLAAALPGNLARARKSALSSLGWWIRGELRNHIEYGGSHWPPLHPLTMKFRKKRGIKAGPGAWGGRRRGRHNTALFWLGKFARYRVDKEGELLDVDFGRSRAGKPGSFDASLSATVRRAERGERIRVSEKMRRFLAATRRKRPKRQVPGKTYFPLRKTTRVLVVPPRPIFGPVKRKVEPQVPAYFTRKFWGAFERYTTGKKKSWTN